MKKQSVPTEVDSNFEPTGDDATRGYLWTHQKYDWKGRVVRKINTDGIDQTTLNDSDIIISYEGCGCAGGQITTIESERVPYGTSSFGRRKQKVYEDTLGRSWKTESFDWDGSTVYSTQTQLFDGRDQAVRTRQYSGTDSSSTYQDYTAEYDGFGRVESSHKPEQRNDSNTLKYTTYTYNLDDSIQSTTDGRGVVTSYTYNSRGLVTEVSRDVGTTGIPEANDVTFAYDNLGNRTQMTDGLGQVDYEYDSLSRMISETRDFTDNLPYAPISGSKYKFEYTYDLSGLKLYKEPFGETVTYTNDKSGRLTQVAGAWSGGSQTYANNPHYRAWGALQNLDYGNGTKMNVTAFNNRLQATEFEVKKDTTSIISKEYEFYADGQVKLSTDNNNAKFDRLFKYDHQARVTNVMSGAEARGSTDTAANIPFGNTFGYDAFDHQSSIYQKHFTNVPTGSFSYTHANNRLVGMGNGFYDTDGRQLKSADNVYKAYAYNAAGQMSSSYFQGMTQNNTVLAYENYETISYSGDGKIVKIATLHDPVEGDSESDVTYQIHSTVLGQTISKAQSGGQKLVSSIVTPGSVIAVHHPETITWTHRDPNSDSIRSTDSSGNLIDSDDDFGKLELDGLGRSVGLTNPYSGDPQWDSIPDLYQAQQSYPAIINGRPLTYKLDGLEVPRKTFEDQVEFAFGSVFRFLEMQSRLVGMTMHEEPNKGVVLTRWWLYTPAWGGDLFKERRVTGKEASQLVEAVTAAADNAEMCRKYIADLINKVAEMKGVKVVSTDVETLFMKVFNSRTPAPNELYGGIFINFESGGHARNHWSWEGGLPGSAEIYLGFEGGMPYQFYSVTSEKMKYAMMEQQRERFLSTPGYGGIMAIHELMHVALFRKADDVDFARAAAEIAGDSFVLRPYEAKQADSLENQPFNYQGSNYWGERLNQACGYPSQITKKMTNYRLYK